MSDEVKETRLQAIERKRAEQRAAATAGAEDQEATDLEAIVELEAQHGFNNVAVLELPYLGEGLPVRVAVRAPTAAEFKRYRAKCVPMKDGRNNEIPGDPFAAAEQLAATCFVYPARDVLDTLCAARPGLLVQLGVQAAKLASAEEERQGK